MVIKVCLIHCHIITFILLSVLKDYIQSDMYLSEATVTAELQNCVLAYNPESCGGGTYHLADYLSFVGKLVHCLRTWLSYTYL